MSSPSNTETVKSLRNYRYSIIDADLLFGIKEYPEKQMETIGFHVVKAEAVPVADCWLFRVDNDIPVVPDYLYRLPDDYLFPDEHHYRICIVPQQLLDL